MSKEVIRQAQLAQLKIMKHVHNVCMSHKINYYIIGGTALGAVRHGGFIPWDPDIDIAMPRPDYDRFLKECNDDLSPLCSIKSYINDKNHHAPHALVVLNGSSIRNRHDKYNNEPKNIYVDVFPLDVAPNDKYEQEKQAKEIIKLKMLLERKRSVIFNHNNWIQRLAKKIVRSLMSVVSYRYICGRLDKAMKHYSYPYPEGDFYLCSMASHYSYTKQCMPKDVYGTPVLLSFEGNEFFAPEKVDDYLTRLFKNYMELPPKEEQDRWYSYLEDVEII